MIGVAIIALWVYCDMIFPQALLHAGVSPMLAPIVAMVGTAIVLAAAPAMPIQLLFPNHAPAAAAAIGWLPLALAVILSSGALGVALVAGCANWMAIVLGTWLVARVRQSGSSEHE